MRKLVKTVVPLKVGKVFEFPCNRFLDWSVAGRHVVIRCLNWVGEASVMRWLVAILLGVLLCGCTTYNERFTYVDPNTGSTNHTVHISYRSCLMWGEAAKLKTETQTMEFIRTVNADGLVSKPDADSIKAIADGIVQAILNAASQGAVP